MGDYVHKKIMAKLDETEAIAVKEKIESNQEDINDLFFNESQDDEWEFIEHFEAVAKKDGLFYTKKDLINFHAAVKSSSLEFSLDLVERENHNWCNVMQKH